MASGKMALVPMPINAKPNNATHSTEAQVTAQTPKPKIKIKPRATRTG
jgi:hypothetical protein